MSWKGFDSAWLDKHENHPHPARLPHSQQRQLPTPLEGDCGEKTRCPTCPVVRFTLCRVRLLDVDAKYASVKDLLDGLAAAELIHGDKEGQVRLEVFQERVGNYADEKTLIEIDYGVTETSG